MPTIRFDTTKEDSTFIRKIVQRARAIDPSLDALSVSMDLTACHLNGCPLRLQDMADWPRDFDIMHDVYGIAGTIERDESKATAGQLRGMFRPRFAAPASGLCVATAGAERLTP